MAELTKWLLILALVINVVGVAKSVGKPREPLAVSDAVVICVVNSLVIVTVLAFWET